MELKPYLLQMPMPERVAFARRCGTTYGHLRNVAYAEKTCAETLALNIERESGGAVPLSFLRPDLDATLAASGYVKAAAQEEAA